MRIGIIGCGNMGGALTRGILSKRILPFNNIYVNDRDQQKTRELYRKFGIRVTDAQELVRRSNFIIVAVKPQDAGRILGSIAKDLDSAKHLISIMAGLSLAKIEKLTGRKIAVTRAMPNMAAIAGKSMTCVCHNKRVKEKAVVNRIFSSVGEVIELDEKHMDAVTAVSASGLAYFYHLAECLRDAAVKLGLKKEHAVKFAEETLIGSGALLEHAQTGAEVLRERITSKKGTTEAALSVLRSKEFKRLVLMAVNEAARRSKELSKTAL